MTSRVQVVATSMSPTDVAQVSFRAGWRAACLTLAEALEEAGAPADSVAAARAIADLAPTPRVGIATSAKAARAAATGKAVQA